MADHCCLYLSIYSCPRDQANAVLDLLEKNDLSTDDGSPKPAHGFQLAVAHYHYEAPADAANEIAGELAELPGVAFAVYDAPEYGGLGTSVMHTPELGTWRGSCDEDGEDMFNADEITRAIAAGTVEQLLGQPWRQALVAYQPDEKAPPAWVRAPELLDACWIVREEVVEIEGQDDLLPVAGRTQEAAEDALRQAGWSVPPAQWQARLSGRAYEFEAYRTQEG